MHVGIRGLERDTWHVATVGSCGIVAHRGVLTPDEWKWLDREAIAAVVERHLGFTVDEVSRAYGNRGRPSHAQRELRARIDARFLELRRAGGNLAALGRLLGFGVDPQKRSCWVIDRAVARARIAEALAS